MNPGMSLPPLLLFLLKVRLGLDFEPGLTTGPEPCIFNGHVVPIAVTSQLSRANCVGVGPSISAPAVDSTLVVSDWRAYAPRPVVPTVEPGRVRNTHDQY